jgi:cation transport protein ChaC
MSPPTDPRLPDRATLRPAHPDDVPALQRIRAAVRENRLVSRTLTDRDVAHAITEGGRGWVVERDHEVLGFGIGLHDGRLWALFVDPAAEGRGYGRALLAAATRWMFDLGHDRLELSADPGTRAQRLYEAAGWAFAGVRDDGEHAYERHRETAPAAVDPYRHLPQLRGRITPAERSVLRMTPEVLARWDHQAREQGRPAAWRWSDAELDATHRELLGGHDPADGLWVFGYGSLMWDPGVHFAEVRLGTLAGWRRRFGFTTTLGRGSPERPGLMLTLDEGEGDCEGLAFRLAPEYAHAESALLWRREMIRGSYRPRMLMVSTPQGPVETLVFTCNREHDAYVGDLPLARCAEVIARGEGVLGRNRDYLESLARQLAALGLHDPYVSRLLAQVRQVATD